MDKDNRFLFLFSEESQRFQVDMELANFYAHSYSPDYEVVLEFEDSDAVIWPVTIKCRSIDKLRKVCDKICESFLSHPGVLDLRGLVSPKDVIDD